MKLINPKVREKAEKISSRRRQHSPFWYTDENERAKEKMNVVHGLKRIPRIKFPQRHVNPSGFDYRETLVCRIYIVFGVKFSKFLSTVSLSRIRYEIVSIWLWFLFADLSCSEKIHKRIIDLHLHS